MKTPVIYIVDNDFISAFDIKIRIHQAQIACKVKSFEDTDAAFEMLSANYEHEYGLPDIMLLSVDMGGFDGLSFLRKLEKSESITEKMNLYIFSTFSVPADRQKYTVNKKVNGFFTKPLSKKEIQTIFADFQSDSNRRQISA